MVVSLSVTSSVLPEVNPSWSMNLVSNLLHDLASAGVRVSVWVVGAGDTDPVGVMGGGCFEGG